MNPVPVQIESVTLEPKSAHNPDAYRVVGVCGECTKCGRTASANPETFRGGPKTKRNLAVLAVLEEIASECPHPLPWGSTPVHDDRRIPRGLTLFALEKTTGNRQAVAVDAKGKLVGAWGGVAPAAVVLVVPADAKYVAAAHEFSEELKARGYVGARAVEPESAEVKA
jgi:hypothetical protein